ncbi:hypothetical protein [uncultured Pseudokineococcus sp.]|uniref:hypothetical protein n=1 Tax=uncultured Pseudokineococcus sp. TaxID=1642928 RepID=UPI00262E964C|nr:hypothetical protein [uncultured Pseudokineococcus sp.]
MSLRPLQRVLARWAVRGTTVLLVEAPGGWAARVAVERAMAERGWRAASSPADADALVVCGTPGDGWGEVLERTWAQLPGPRARASVAAPSEVPGALEGLAASLLDDDVQRVDAAARDLVPADVEPGDDMHPAGLELAGGEDDLRDGLEMDVLRVPLGPVLPDWPAGLVLRTVLSGDVVVRARVEVLPGAPQRQDPADDVARRLDAAAQVLRLAGADDLAARAVRLRDAVPAPRTSSTDRPEDAPSPRTSSTHRPQRGALSGTSSTDRREGGAGAAQRRRSAGDVRELRGRVERSRVLAWALREADVVTSSPTSGAESDAAPASAPDDLRDVGLDARRRTRDDVRTLLLGLLDLDARDDDPGRRIRAALDALPERLVGVDVVSARLLVAALDLRTDTLDADDLAALAPREDDSDDDSSDDDSDDGSDQHMHHGHAHG